MQLTNEQRNGLLTVLEAALYNTDAMPTRVMAKVMDFLDTTEEEPEEPVFDSLDDSLLDIVEDFDDGSCPNCGKDECPDWGFCDDILGD